MQVPTLLPESVHASRPARLIRIGEQVSLPVWVQDLASFRRWATSDDLPRRGWFSYLDGEIWVDLSMEQLFDHNQVKGEFAFGIMALLRGDSLGRYFHDRTRLSHSGADLSTEPDGLFYTWESLRGGRIRLVKGAEHGHVELEGTPDMVLEVVSDSSVRKDNELLPTLYWRAGLAEYWIVDARGPKPLFTIFRHAPDGYVRVAEQDGWLTSAIFNRQFQFVRIADDPTGQPQYTLLIRALATAATGTIP